MKRLLISALSLLALLRVPGQEPAAPAPPPPPPPATPGGQTPPPAPRTGKVTPEELGEAYKTVRRHAEALTSSTGALTGVVLLDAYLGIVHADLALEAKMDGKAVEAQLIRHLATLGVLEMQIKKLKEALAGQKGFEKFLEATQQAVDMLKDLGATVRELAQGKANRATSPYLQKKEAVRTYLMKFIQFPDNRDLAP